MNIRWSPTAQADLEDIHSYIAKDNAAAADRMVAVILAATRALERHPEMGRPGRVAGTRELVIVDSPYFVPYRVARGELEILAVIHGARNWPPR